MIFLKPKSPHAFMESSRVKIPHVKTGCHIFPSLEVMVMLHLNVKHVYFELRIGDEVVWICARRFGMVQSLGFAIKTDEISVQAK